MRDISLYTCKKEDLDKFVSHLDKTDTKVSFN